MNFKNVKAERNTITRNTKTLEEKGTGNIFETIVVLSRRSDQLSQDLKKELNSKMEEFVIPNDTLEEVFENFLTLPSAKRPRPSPSQSIAVATVFSEAAETIAVTIATVFSTTDISTGRGGMVGVIASSHRRESRVINMHSLWQECWKQKQSAVLCRKEMLRVGFEQRRQ